MTRKLLVVEDSPTMRQLLVYALRPLSDLSVVEAVDGLDGYKKLQADKFDLIILDINMPLMDGLKLLSMIRQDPRNSQTPVMMVTTEGGVEAKKKADSLGVAAYITKPIMGGYVLNKVRELLGTEAGPPAP